MERFATNKNGNIDSGTEVLANNMVFLQQAKANAISNIFKDFLIEGGGILNTGNSDTMFKVSANNDGTFNVGIGIAYKEDINVTPSMYERIEIIDDTEEYDANKPSQVTPDGAGQYVLTPKSTGCKNISIPNENTEYYVDIRYLNVCDNGNAGDNLGLINYSIAKSESINSNIQKKRFYKWINGYQIVLVPKPQTCLGICVGTVSKTGTIVTITNENRSGNLLIQSRVFMDYFDAGQGITFVDVGSQKVLGVNVDNITTEINSDNQVRVTKDGLYSYTKFAINSGPAIFLTGTGNEISTFNSSTPLWLNPAYADRYNIVNKGLAPLNVWSAVQQYFGSNPGRYTVCINNTDRENNTLLEEPKLELMGYIYVGKTAPVYGTTINYDSSTGKAIEQNFDIWLDTSNQPYKAKMYYNGNWIDYNGVPVGLVNWVSTTVGIEYGSNLFQFDFNKDYIKWDTLGDLKINFKTDNPNSAKYVLCNGGAVLKFLYNDLYREIGDKCGAYDPLEPLPADAPIWATADDYFLLPDFQDKTIWGGISSNIGTYLEAGLPNLKGHNTLGASGYYSGVVNNDGNRSGVFSGTQWKTSSSVVAMTRTDQWTVGAGTPLGVSFDASESSSIYKDSVTTVQPPALQVPIYIKYAI